MANTGNNAIVTGATGAIGKAIARQMAEQGYHVTIIARDETKARRTVEEIKSATGNSELQWLIADLSRKREIEQLQQCCRHTTSAHTNPRRHRNAVCHKCAGVFLDDPLLYTSSQKRRSIACGEW